MDEDKILLSRKELEIAEQESKLTELGLSDDDLAASLGFMTTLQEQAMTPNEEETDMQEGESEDGPPEEEPKEPVEEAPAEGVPDPNKEAAEVDDINKRQDEEIASIKSELEKLLREEELENDQKGENTETTGEAE